MAPITSYEEAVRRLQLAGQHAHFSADYTALHPRAKESHDIAEFAIQVLYAAQAESYYHKDTILHGIAKMGNGMERNAAMAEARQEAVQRAKDIANATFITRSVAGEPEQWESKGANFVYHQLS